MGKEKGKRRIELHIEMEVPSLIISLLTDERLHALFDEAFGQFDDNSGLQVTRWLEFDGEVSRWVVGLDLAFDDVSDDLDPEDFEDLVESDMPVDGKMTLNLGVVATEVWL